MPSNDTHLTKAQRQADARARAAELRRKQEQSSRRNKFLAIGGAIVALLVIVGAVGFVLIQNHQNATASSSVAFGAGDADSKNLVSPALTAVQKPAATNDTAGIPISANGVGKAATGGTVLQIFFDLQCPYCAQFDKANAADLDALAKEPGVTVVYQPLSFLDASSQGTRYSNRAANALMTVADKDPSHFTAFLTALYADQPAENTKGLTDDKIASIATTVGVPQSVISTFTATVSGPYQLKDASGTATSHTGTWRTFAPFVAAATANAGSLPVFATGLGTPTILLDGTQIGTKTDGINIYQQGQVKAAVDAAVAKKG
jgi:protein-disulfide isomerase